MISHFYRRVPINWVLQNCFVCFYQPWAVQNIIKFSATTGINSRATPCLQNIWNILYQDKETEMK